MTTLQAEALKEKEALSDLQEPHPDLQEPHPDFQENELRPKNLSNYIGQKTICHNLSVFIQAALQRNQPLDHVLLSGPPGLGKTSLAYIIAREQGHGLRTTSGPVLEKQGDLAAILTSMSPSEVLFIDEIHRLPRNVEEVLYSAMEDFQLPIIVGQGPMARTVRLEVPRFTLVGATTRTGMLSEPLRERFGIRFQLGFYSVKELCKIVENTAEKLSVGISKEASQALAKRSRGTPRVAQRLLKRMRDFAQEAGKHTIDTATINLGLKNLGVDGYGLEGMHLGLLKLLVHQFGGGPVGLSTLVAATAESKETIEQVYEPYLIQEGFLQKTPKGRVATKKAFQHLEKSSQ